MKITGKFSIAFFLKLGIDLVLLVNILTLLTLPFLLESLYEKTDVENTRNDYSQTTSISVSEAGNDSNYDSETGSISYAGNDSTLIRGNSRWILLNEIPDESYGFMLGFLYFSGIGTAMILVFLRKVLKNLEKDIILDHSNAKAFKLLSFACFILVISFIVKIIFYNTFLTMFSFFVFTILGLFTLVLSEVFRQGAIIKEENELTI